MIPNLNELLNYRNEKVLSRYKKDFPESILSADTALKELMKYMWLVCKHTEDKVNDPNNQKYHFDCVMHYEMFDIDNLWHTFLLFTQEYQNFCKQYLGGYFFHHFPSEDEKAKSPHEYAKDLERYLTYIYDHLGEDTVRIWFKQLQD